MQLRVLLWLAVCLLSACAPVAEHNSQLDTIYQRNSLRVGLLHGPTSYFIGVDGPAGFEYELAQTLAQRLDVELELFPSYHLDELLQKLDTGQVDFIAGGLTLTPERLSRYGRHRRIAGSVNYWYFARVMTGRAHSMILPSR